jgi:hypothetical protein
VLLSVTATRWDKASKRHQTCGRLLVAVAIKEVPAREGRVVGSVWQWQAKAGGSHHRGGHSSNTTTLPASHRHWQPLAPREEPTKSSEDKASVGREVYL